MDNVKKFDKFNEEIDFTTPENKERLDIVKKKLSEIEIKNEFKKELEFLKKIADIYVRMYILSRDRTPIDPLRAPLKKRISELEEIIENL